MKRIVLLVLFMMIVMGVQADNVKKINRSGNTFIEVVNKKASLRKTGFTYKDSKGNVYDIYLSSKGKAFILKKSKKTGKEYRYYLPNEIAEQIKSELK